MCGVRVVLGCIGGKEVQSLCSYCLILTIFVNIVQDTNDKIK